jgi:hemerythrin superfamily protein
LTRRPEEEEEGKMFPKVRELCDQQELDDLGEQLEAAKAKLKRKTS